mgnify:CR=1 FL=1
MNIKSDFDYLEKICLLGQSTVGKTNLIIRFVDNKYNPDILSTAGFDYKSKTISLKHSKKKVKLKIYDTAGQEKYMAVCKYIYKQTDGIILVYDITSRESYEYIPQWIQEIKKYNKHLPIFLIGNKIDDEENRLISFEEGKKFADENNMEFIYVDYSAGRVSKTFVFPKEQQIINLNGVHIKVLYADEEGIEYILLN